MREKDPVTRDLVRSLKREGKRPIPCNEEKKNLLIADLVKKEIPVRKTGSFLEFLLLQINFINKTVVFWQAAWILLFFLAVWKGYITNEELCILSMAPPLLLLLTIEELARVYNRSMLEIEYATKYSLRKVVMGRMLLLGIANGGVLLAGLLYAKWRMGLQLVETFVYSLTPLVLMAFLLLMLMKRWKGEQLKYAGVSVYIILMLAVLAGVAGKFDIYGEGVLWVWMVLLAGGMAAAVYQFRSLMKHLGCFEGLAAG